MRAVLIASLAAIVQATDAYAMDDAPDGQDSFYAAWLSEVLRSWPVRRVEVDDARVVNLRCIGTPGDEMYVGIAQYMTIDAPLSTVEGVLDDVAHYKELFPGIVDVKIVAGLPSENRYLTEWEQKVPVFFLPNITYELNYVVDRSTDGIRVYRYKLRHSGKIKSSDGMVIIEAIGPTCTHFAEFDFFKAEWGPLPAPIVWHESVKSSFLSDLAIKLKAENVGWSYPRIARETMERLAVHAAEVDRCHGERTRPTAQATNANAR